MAFHTRVGVAGITCPRAQSRYVILYADMADLPVAVNEQSLPYRRCLRATWRMRSILVDKCPHLESLIAAFLSFKVRTTWRTADSWWTECRVLWPAEGFVNVFGGIPTSRAALPDTPACPLMVYGLDPLDLCCLKVDHSSACRAGITSVRMVPESLSERHFDNPILVQTAGIDPFSPAGISRSPVE
ncbi:hypothetical protein BV20DRAFT_48183 [Pilatotrama ljubarskyi]|nr:hypothetical protein BV20DRAFT_48183 [Pilatotrama ljubarskyi]